MIQTKEGWKELPILPPRTSRYGRFTWKPECSLVGTSAQADHRSGPGRPRQLPMQDRTFVPDVSIN
jgi:hypothetical protein